VPGRLFDRQRFIVSLVGWETMQRQTAEGAVESEQRILLASPAVPFDHAGAVQLGDRYWREVRRATWGLIRPRRRGKHLELRILGRGAPLLSFAEPSFEVMPRRVACRFPIAGGLLVQQPPAKSASRRRPGSVSSCARRSAASTLVSRPAEVGRHRQARSTTQCRAESTSRSAAGTSLVSPGK
jgi:hypothetical protein